MKNSIIAFVSILILSIGCNTGKQKHDIGSFYKKQVQDTLMTNIITYIYKVPRGADPKRKHDLEYRQLYVNQIDLFKFVKYHIDTEDSTHYFYLIRPARNEKGFKRGVLGKYKIDGSYNLLDFEEIANTPMIPEEEILENGEYLWKDLIHLGNVDRYFLNKKYIEFPDERARYDKNTNQWTYEK
jgi:hypothetical protein